MSAHRAPGLPSLRARRAPVTPLKPPRRLPVLFGAFAFVLAVLLSGCAPVDPAASPVATTTHSASHQKKTTPSISKAKRNAIRSAEGYLRFSGFSKDGLIQQLTSTAADGYARADAVYAVNHVDVDWNAEAVEAGKSYLDYDGFSRTGLIRQLSSPAGDRFTKAQATYAANKLGL